MVNADSERKPKGEEGGEWVSGRTLSDSLFYLLSIFIAADLFLLILSALSGNLPYLAAIAQTIILVPLIFVFYYFRRRRAKPQGRDFNI